MWFLYGESVVIQDHTFTLKWHSLVLWIKLPHQFSVMIKVLDQGLGDPGPDALPNTETHVTILHRSLSA